VADWTDISALRAGLAPRAASAKSWLPASPSAGAAAKLKAGRLADQFGVDHAADRQKANDVPGRDGDEEAKPEPEREHLTGALPLEGRPGAQDHERIDDRRRQHVGDRVGQRQAFPDEAANHDDAPAFAHRQDEPQQAAGEDGDERPFRQEAPQQFRRDEDIDDPGDQRAEQEERHAFEQHAEEGEREILEVEGKPGHATGAVLLMQRARLVEPEEFLTRHFRSPRARGPASLGAWPKAITLARKR
jgi:hypothetical protein